MSEGWTTTKQNHEATSSTRGLAFQVRPVPFVIAGRHYELSVVAAQVVLKEINRLTTASSPLAQETGMRISQALSDGSSVHLTDTQARTLLVAIERIRLRSGRLPADLVPLRAALLGAPVSAA